VHDKRHGPLDRRVSKRGGRRETDTMRGDVDALRLKWEELETGEEPSAVARRDSGADQAMADHAELGGGRRSLVPPRK
jgi:hypothetical protein